MARIDWDWPAQLEGCQIRITRLEAGITSQKQKIQHLSNKGLDAAFAQRVLVVRADSFERQAREAATMVEELRKGLAGLQLAFGKERSLRRLVESRRSRPHDQQVAAELARRRAEREKATHDGRQA